MYLSLLREGFSKRTNGRRKNSCKVFALVIPDPRGRDKMCLASAAIPGSHLFPEDPPLSFPQHQHQFSLFLQSLFPSLSLSSQPGPVHCQAGKCNALHCERALNCFFFKDKRNSWLRFSWKNSLCLMRGWEDKTVCVFRDVGKKSSTGKLQGK